MNELTSLLAAAAEHRRAAEPFLVATLVRVRGSSYRRPGARLLLTRDRWVAGSVSGGCLEQDLVRKGWWRTERGPCVVTYDARADDDVAWGLGLRCDGVVDVLLERADAGGVDPLAFVARCFAAQTRGAMATVFAGDAPIGARVAIDASGDVACDAMDGDARAALEAECRAVLASGVTRAASLATARGPIDALVESVRPPPRLFVCGAGHDAAPLVAIAKRVGWETIVAAASVRFTTRARFVEADAVIAATPEEIAARVDASDRALAVLMAHDYERDRATLAALLGSRACYVGVLGPRKRTARMLGEIGAGEGDARLHAPVGLAIGAEGPQEIALAIAAEAQAVLARADATSLRERRGPIHEAAE